MTSWEANRLLDDAQNKWSLGFPMRIDAPKKTIQDGLQGFVVMLPQTDKRPQQPPREAATPALQAVLKSNRLKMVLRL